jgi:hypothetical protein
LTTTPPHAIIKKKQEVMLMKKDTMKMRKEWVNEVLDALDDLEEKAETNGESALMWEILKTVRENIEIGE